jgi:iron complex outermembrane receptor protein
VYAPRHAAVIEFGYDAPWRGPGHLMLHADAAYASGQYTYNSDTLPSPSSLVFNARIGIEDLALAGGTLSLAVWVRNAFDRAYELAGIGGPLGPLAVFGEGRSVGIDAKLSFGRH